MRRLILLALAGGSLLAAQWEMASPVLRVNFDPALGYAITGLQEIDSGRNHIAPETRLPLYRLTLSGEDGSAVDITSADAASVSPQRNGNTTTLVFLHPAQKLQITCTVRLEPSQRQLIWKIAIRNQGSFGVRSLYYPQWPAPLRLPRGETRLLYPFLDGQEFIEPGEHLAEGRARRMIYPGQAALQLIAYHDEESGLLEMTRDGDGWVKHFRALRIPGALDLSVEHNPDERAGANIDLPYETIWQVFRGGWQDAADIYRDWAVQQKWARQKIAERHPPRYLTAGLPVVVSEIRGDPYSAEWSMYFPPSNRLINPDFHPSKIPGLMNQYSRFFGSPVISSPFGWENVAPWMAGKYFPPVGGEQLWSRMAAALRSAGNPLLMLLSGSRWGVTMDNVGFDQRQQFLKETAPAAAVYNAAGQPSEEQPPWAASVQLCVGTPFSRRHIIDAFVGCVKRGASLVQYDQNHGGAAFVCYHPKHPHSRGYGPWMVRETEQIFQQIRTESKRLNPDFALAVEEPCEYFIPQWELYMGRPYAFFGTGLDPSSHRVAVPLFIYVYHEYLLGYGGSNESDIAHPYAEAIKIARKFTNGTLLEIDPGKPAFRLDTIPSPTEELQLARSCSRALRTYANPYLIGGRMLRDPVILDRQIQKARMWRDVRDTRPVETLPTVDVPLVLASAWESEGRVAYVFANWQTSKQTVTFIPQPYRQQRASYGVAVYSGGKGILQRRGALPKQIRIVVPPLSAMMVEQGPDLPEPVHP